MALEELLARLRSEKSVTPLTPAVTPDVTVKPATILKVTYETPVTAENPIPVTLEYFSGQGAALLAEDLAFLRWYLPTEAVKRNAYIAQYLNIWRDAAEREPVSHRKENSGRRKANSWLRTVIE
jgi:hypothetical protein